MSTTEVVVDLGPVCAAVHTDAPAVLDELHAFYTLTQSTEHRPMPWTIDARLVKPSPDMAQNPWGVGYRAELGGRRIQLHGTDQQHLAITTRKAAREVLLEFCEERGYTMLHASAVADEQWLIVLTGESCSGKTTLALNGVISEGMQYVSNDHLILYRDAGQLVATSLPTPIPIKVGTYLDYADQIGHPWDAEVGNLARYLRMPAQQRYRSAEQVYVTYPGLSQRNPVHLDVAGRQVLVALTDYAGPTDPVNLPTPVEDPVAALWPHVRFDWIASDANTHYLPRAERTEANCTRDALAALAALAAEARVVSWHHHGVLAPVRDWLTGNEERR